MQPDISVNFVDLEEGSDNLTGAMKGIQIHLAILDQDVKPIEQSWGEDSEAFGAYLQHRSRLQTHVDNISLIIKDFANTTMDASHFQQLVERQIKDSFHYVK